MELRAGYRQTEIGFIPDGWDVKTLGSMVFSHNSGVYKNQLMYGRGHAIVGVSDIYAIDKVDGQAFPVVPLSPQERAKFSLKANDLLYGESSLVREGIARTVYVTKRGCGTAFAWHTRRYSVNPRIILSPYLYYYLQSRPARAHMISNSIQTAITGINTTAYFSCPVITPPLREQEAIAEALSDADALIESLEQLVAKKRQIKQGAMQELLTGKRRLPGFGGEWGRKRLADLASLSKAGINPADSPKALCTHFSLPAFDAGEVPVVEEGGEIGSNKFLVPEGAVLISKLNPRIPRVWAPKEIPTNAVCSTEFLVLVPREQTDRGYLAAVCMSPDVCYQMELHAIGTTGSHQRINPSQAMSIEVSAPFDRAEQSAIASALLVMESELALLIQKLTKARAIKQGMMQELLTGKTRLI